MTMKIHELTGKRFGRLTVVEFVGTTKSKKSLWRCLCDCGKEITVLASNLNRGSPQSCGCDRKERYKDLTDTRFGRLITIDRVGKNKHGLTLWLCKCDCGKEAVVTSSRLTTGHTASCGCLKIELTKQRTTTHGMAGTQEYSRYKKAQRREKELSFNSTWTIQQDLALSSFSNRCAICGITDQEHQRKHKQHLHADHLHPLQPYEGEGQPLRPGNVVRLCRECNTRKSNTPFSELPLETRSKLIAAARAFKEYWDILEYGFS